MAKAPPDLSSVLLKLDRASEHLDCLREQTRTFLERKPAPFDFRTEKTTRRGKPDLHILRAIVRREPPRELGLTVGDVVQNIRHALDHLVYELSTPSRRNRGKTGFPIFDDRCRFEVLGEPMIKGITGDERTLIERHQPYQASHPPGNHPLAILNKLANQDKHRVLLPVIAAVNNTGSWIGSTNADIRIERFHPGPVQNDAEIMAFTATPKDPADKMHVEPQSALEIQLADTGAVGMSLEVSDLLDMLHHYVRHSLIEMWFRYGQVPPAVESG
jgi:hypothetical protein